MHPTFTLLSTLRIVRRFDEGYQNQANLELFSYDNRVDDLVQEKSRAVTDDFSHFEVLYPDLSKDDRSSASATLFKHKRSGLSRRREVIQFKPSA